MALFRGLEGPPTSEKSFPHDHLLGKLKCGQVGFDFLLKYFFLISCFQLVSRELVAGGQRSAAGGQKGWKRGG